ncbi:MAG: AraC family transcriptional regulator, partial [Pseudomonadota bacterium]
MLRPPITVSIAFVQGMVSGLRMQGRSSDVFLADAGIAPELLTQAGARITADQYSALFMLLIERLDDECIALLSRPLKRGSFALMVRSALSAPILDVALRRVARTFRLLQDDVVVELVRDGNEACLSLRLIDPSRERAVFLHELLLRVFWRVAAWLAGGALPAVRFDFAFDAPAHADSYGKVFPAPLRFACRSTAFWFDAARLKDPVRRDEAALRS